MWGGNLSKVLVRYGYNVYSTDLIDRNYGDDFIDFLTYKGQWNGDILTNPPYKDAYEFINKSLEIIPLGNYVIMFLKITFLEGKRRKILFKNNPPKYVYVSSSRFNCPKNGDFSKNGSSAIGYAWYVWEKGYKGDTIIRWFN